MQMKDFTAMEEYICYFDIIEYAVYNTQRELANYAAFYREMK